MRFFRVALLVLAVLHLVFALITGAVGGFADGGDLLQRLTLMVVHPVTAVALLYLVAVRAPARRLLRLGAALIVINVVADAYQAVAILSGNVLGDWELAVAFSVVPVLGLVYVLALLTRRTA